MSDKTELILHRLDEHESRLDGIGRKLDAVHSQQDAHNLKDEREFGRIKLLIVAGIVAGAVPKILGEDGPVELAQMLLRLI